MSRWLQLVDLGRLSRKLSRCLNRIRPLVCVRLLVSCVAVRCRIISVYVCLKIWLGCDLRLVVTRLSLLLLSRVLGVSCRVRVKVPVPVRKRRRIPCRQIWKWLCRGLVTVHSCPLRKWVKKLRARLLVLGPEQLREWTKVSIVGWQSWYSLLRVMRDLVAVLEVTVTRS